jgi:type IX secretion system PorP/SprF family membrane protein
MRELKSTLTFVVMIVLMGNLTAQDVHFSQFYNSPMTLNPALTGLISEDIRATANYRSQWGTVTAPYETMSASTDFSILKGTFYDDYMGVGLLVMNDKAGDLNLRNTQVQLSLSYSKALNGDGNQYLTAGVQVGAVQNAFDVNKLLFDSQYDGTQLDPNINSGENIDRPNFTYMDVSAGLAWYYVPDEKTSFYIGVGMAHLNRPNISFYSNLNDRLYQKFTIHGGFEFALSSSISLVPQAIILSQGPYLETNVGSLVKFSVHPDYGTDYGQTAFYIGSMYRFGDAVIPMVRFDYNQVSVTASYDVNVSELDNASRGNGGFEIALVYKQYLFSSPGQRGPVGCPTF